MEEQKAATRSIDEIGRIIIPKDICQTLGWGTGTKLEIAINDMTVKSIVAREVSSCCSLCRVQSEDLMKIEKGYICPECAAQVK